MVFVKAYMRSWLVDLVTYDDFFEPCPYCAKEHHGRDAILNFFDPHSCQPTAYCKYCKDRRASSHRLLKIKRSTYHDVANIDELKQLGVSTAEIQHYVINSQNVVFIRPRPAAPHKSSSGLRCDVQANCISCSRPLMDKNARFCSIFCSLSAYGQLRGVDLPKSIKNAGKIEVLDERAQEELAVQLRRYRGGRVVSPLSNKKPSLSPKLHVIRIKMKQPGAGKQNTTRDIHPAESTAGHALYHNDDERENTPLVTKVDHGFISKATVLPPVHRGHSDACGGTKQECGSNANTRQVLAVLHAAAIQSMGLPGGQDSPCVSDATAYSQRSAHWQRRKQPKPCRSPTF